MSREEVFFDAVTNIREELVEAAQRHVFRRKRARQPKAAWAVVRHSRMTPPGRYAGLAACLVLAAAVCFGAYSLSSFRMGGAGSDSNGMVSTDAGGSSGQSSGAVQDEPEQVQDPEANPADTTYGGEDGTDNQGEAPVSTDQSMQSIVGVILEVHETCLLVSWEEEVLVPTANLEDLPEFREGDVVHVRCEELISQDGVTAASGVEGIWLLEPESSEP